MVKFPVIDNTPKVVTEINFGALDAQNIRKLAALQLHHRDLYDVDDPSRPPAKFGALDSRMVDESNPV